MTTVLTLPLLTATAVVSTDEDWDFVVPYTDDNDDPITLAGVEFDLYARPAAESPLVMFAYASDAAYSWPVAGGTVVVNANTVTVHVPQTVIATLAPGDFVASFRARADGHKRRVLTVALTVEQGLTP